VDLKSQAQPKPPRRKKPPYRKEKWKTYERVSILQGSSLDFVRTTETPDNEKQARRLVRSEVMKNYHAKRRDALKESHINFNVEKSSVSRWRGDPFVKFPVELTFAIKEFLDLGTSKFPLFGLDLCNPRIVFTDTRINVSFYREARKQNPPVCESLKMLNNGDRTAQWLALCGVLPPSPRKHCHLDASTRMSEGIRAIFPQTRTAKPCHCNETRSRAGDLQRRVNQ
jgi:hypothetical protein